jgi:putative membrane protein
VVLRVDDHDEGRWRAATLGAVFAAVAAAAVHELGTWWAPLDPWWVALPALAGAAVGFALAAVPAVERRLLSADDLERRVRLRAASAFLEEEVFRTRERTGVLVFLALFERRAVILADEGIHRAVPSERWEALVAELVAGAAAGRAADALCTVVERCGELLAEHRVERRATDEDELSDAPRIRES